MNAGFLNCPLELSIDNHTLLVIASDGADVSPVRGESWSWPWSRAKLIRTGLPAAQGSGEW